MIGALRGTVHTGPSESILVDVNGVGYEVVPSARVRAAIEGKKNAEFTITIFTDVRENAIQLFGFQDSAERELFCLLRKVKGVGSRLALGIISQLSAEQLLHAIGTEDMSVLKAVSGVGKKTAERVIVELREHVQGLITTDSFDRSRQTATGISGAPQETGQRLDVILALEKLGFPADKAKQVVHVTWEELGGDPQSETLDTSILLQRSLANLSRSGV